MDSDKIVIMKRLLLVLVLLFVAGTSFAENYGFELYPWDTPAVEIVNTLMSNGFSVKAENGLIIFGSPDKNDFFYHNNLLKIKQYLITIDSDKKINSQSFYLDNNYTLEIAFMALLSLITEDKSTLYAQDYEEADGINTFTYSAHLSNCDATYVIHGRDDYYILSVSYKNFD